MSRGDTRRLKDKDDKLNYVQPPLAPFKGKGRDVSQSRWVKVVT